MRLQDVPIAEEAEERSWQVVREAFEVRIPNPRQRIRPSLPAAIVAAGVVLAITAVAVSASGGSVLNTVRDAFGVRNAATELVRLPAAGRLLVNSSDGPWIVNVDGSRRYLGYLGGYGYGQAGWSPHGLYEVVVLHLRELAAIDPKGNLRWSLARGLVSDPRWSDDGYRIAYRSGSSLRVVAGDGTGDHLIATNTAAAAAAWDGPTHQLAYADLRGRIHLVNADTGKTIWTSKPGPVPTSVAWEPSQRQIIALSARAVRVFHANDGKLFKEITIGSGRHVLAVSPDGPVAVTTLSASGQSSIVLLHPAHPWLSPRPVFHGSGEFNSLVWSPNGQWLLASWASADQWVFIKLDIKSGAVERVQAVSSIAREFNSDGPPSLGGWCCTPGIPPT
jgi:WD40 repeat protein